ncbi:retrovirus-related pol polyprotein from transposon TNT 1-94 [Tanacetum coccineum]
MADNRTMAQMLQAPIEGYKDAIVAPLINANNFELKQTLINLVQSEAQTWLDKEPPRLILTWDDLVSKLINQFFSPSKTTYLRNGITTFYQKPNETFNEAWERFKRLLRQCPHHGFSELHQLDTFYNSLNTNDQDALDSAAGGNFLDKMPHDGLAIIESKSKVRYSRSRAIKPRASTNAPLSTSTPSNSFEFQQLAASLEDKMDIRMSRLEKMISEKNVTTPATVKAVEEVCVTCGSNHNFNNCPLTRNEFPVFHDNIHQFQQTAAVGNFVQRNPPNLANQMRPPGYSQNSKAYIILNKHTRKIEESLNVTFDETPPPSKTSPLVDDDLDEEEAIREIEKKNLESVVEDETLEIDEIVNIKESRNHPLENVIGNLNQRTLRSQAQNQSNFYCFISTIEPKNVNEALGDESWIVAMQEELNQFIANDVWELVPQPKNMTIIGTKWVFRNKLDENGIVSRNKARLVAQGYNQQEGIDYDETYAPVARLESIRILLAYACALDFKLFQMDVKSAFLNGFINEEVYVAQPSGFIDFEKPDHVYKLKKALYGLKQAPKAWYDRLKAFLIKHEYKMGMVDNTLFTKKKSSNLIVVQIYVDDIIFGSTCQDMCDEFAKIMHDEFEMSMMGELNFFLGLQQMEDGIFFNQSMYIKERLKKFGLEDSKPMKTSMSSDTKLTKDKKYESVDSIKYRGMIGSLLYLTASRLDIMFSVCLCGRF